MPQPPPLPNRRSPRLPHFDYAEGGAYFVTVCTADRRHLLGEIAQGHIHLTAIGEVAQTCWIDIPLHFPTVTLDAHVVMPNHLHGILFLPGGTSDRFEHHARRFGDYPGLSLGSVVGAFKAAVTRLGRERSLLAGDTPLWQRGYWEHVARSPSDLDRVREYVETNPARWDLDRENAARTGRDDFDAWMETLASTAPPHDRRA